MSAGDGEGREDESATARRDLFDIGLEWRHQMTLAEQVARRWPRELGRGPVDVLALGKAAPEMVTALEVAGIDVRRRLVVTTRDAPPTRDVVVGDHPVPGGASVAAGAAIRDFLDSGEVETPTVILLSGGGSSLAVDLVEPATLEDLGALWTGAVAAGIDITTLNRVRASVSRLGGGMLARRVRSRDLLALTMVDNVVSGAEWVASGPLTDFHCDPRWLEDQLTGLGVPASMTRRWRQATMTRGELMARPVTSVVRHAVVAEPGDLLGVVAASAEARGYRVVSLGARIVDDVAVVAKRVCGHLRAARSPTVVVGVGEVSVRVSGDGSGGRCQEFVVHVAAELDAHPVATGHVMAIASDGRDHVADVGGAWADGSTVALARRRGVEVERALIGHDSHSVLEATDQLMPGGRTGWNLCDLYVALVRPRD